MERIKSPPSDDDYVFPKHIREGFENFKLPDQENFSHHPAFLDKLMRLQGISDAERKKVWDGTGRPECYDCSKEYDADD